MRTAVYLCHSCNCSLKLVFPDFANKFEHLIFAVPSTSPVIIVLIDRLTLITVNGPDFYLSILILLPIPVAARSKAWACGRSLAWIAGSNPSQGMSVSCECYVLSNRGLCVGPITRPEESYRVWCV
jgi:hypothetical protein